MGLTTNKRKLEQPTQCQITISSLMATEVRSRTEFQDVQELLCYVALVCSGKIDVMMCSHSYLSWFEEWFFYLEMVYGHSAIRWEDYCTQYHISIYVLRRVFKDKLAIVLRSRQQ